MKKCFETTQNLIFQVMVNFQKNTRKIKIYRTLTYNQTWYKQMNTSTIQALPIISNLTPKVVANIFS